MFDLTGKTALVTGASGGLGGAIARRRIEAGPIPVVMLVRNGTVLPQIQLAQSTMQMDWSKLDLVVYAKDSLTAKGLVCLPSDNVLHELVLNKSGGGFKLVNDPLAGKVTWNLRPAAKAG